VTKKTNTTIWADREPGLGERYLYLWDPVANVYLEKIAPIEVDPAEEAEKAFVARLEDRDAHPELYRMRSWRTLQKTPRRRQARTP
jgi:hypothetical protein